VHEVAGYRIESELAFGGMGTVYRARRGDEPAVALKVLRPQRDAHKARARFAREAERALRISHPNVVRVLDFGETEGGDLYLAMELLEGQDLDVRIVGGVTLDPAEVVRIGCAAASGLEAVHAAGIVHRDVKPANLFLCADGRVKVLDFGLSVAMAGDEAETRLTDERRAMGTPSYLSVEQAEGRRDEDARTDVWGLGAALYHAVAGHPPFDADNLIAMLIRIVSDEPDPLPPHVPSWLGAILLRALQKKREARWPDMASFREALSDGLAHAATAVVARAATPRPGDVAPPHLALGDEVRIVSLLYAEGVQDSVVLAAAVRDEQGVPFRLAGQRAIGVFGGAAWQGDEAERAVRAALSLRARDAAGRPVALRLGVATGRALRSRGEQVTGEVVVAAQNAATTAGVGADAETLRRIRGGYFVDGDRDDRTVSAGGGRVLARRRGATVVGVRGPGGDDVPLLGRERELADLEATLTEVTEGRSARAVLLLGPAGIGKSRLRHALQRRVVERDLPVYWFEGHGEAHRSLKGWHVIETALRQILELPEGSAAEEAREALRTLCPSEECAAFVGEVLSAHFPAVSGLVTARNNPSVMRDRLVIALGDLFESLCRRQPVVLVVDDAQWADRPSLELVDTLVERLAGQPILLVACARSDPTSALAAFRRIELGGLDLAATRALAEAVTGGHRLDGAAAKAIHERSGGNPFFVEELARAWREGREQMPTSVEAAVQARLDGLPRSSKDLLRRASVLGRRFWMECLVDMGEPEPAPILAALSREDLVAPERSARLAATTEWSFKSTLVQQTAYESLTPAQRTALHQAAARWLAGRRDSEAAEIARHLELADDPAAATPHWLRAADRALQSGDTPLAIEASGRALARPLDRPTAFRLRAKRTDVFALTGRWREEEDELELLAGVATTPIERAFLCEARARRLRNRSQFADAQAAIEQGLALQPTRASLLVEAALIRALAGAPEQGLPLVAEAIGRAIEEDDRLTMARALACAAHCHATLGDIGAARPLLAEALEAFREQGDPARALTLELNLGYNDLMLGLHEQASRRLEGALARARATGNRSAQGWALHNLGLALARGGRVEEGLDAEAAALAIGHASREPRLVLSSLKYAAAILLEAGRPAEALERVAQAAGEPDALPDTTAAELGTLRAVALLGLGRVDEARRHAESALALRDRIGGLDAFESELFLAAEDAGVAGSLGRGMAILEARATRIGDPSLRRSFLEQVPGNARLAARARQ